MIYDNVFVDLDLAISKNAQVENRDFVRDGQEIRRLWCDLRCPNIVGVQAVSECELRIGSFFGLRSVYPGWSVERFDLKPQTAWCGRVEMPFPQILARTSLARLVA